VNRAKIEKKNQEAEDSDKNTHYTAEPYRTVCLIPSHEIPLFEQLEPLPAREPYLFSLPIYQELQLFFIESNAFVSENPLNIRNFSIMHGGNRKPLLT
jgi:hypothetical protein